MMVLREDAGVSTVDGYMVLTMEGGDLAILNETASLILEELLQGSSRSKIAAKVSSQFDIDLPTAKMDIEDFIAEMNSHSLLEQTRTRNGC